MAKCRQGLLKEVVSWINPRQIVICLQKVGSDTAARKALGNEEVSENENKALDSLLASLITSVEPEVPRPNDDYAYGPFIFGQNSLTRVDKHQKNISRRLANRLREKLRSLYSGYG